MVNWRVNVPRCNEPVEVSVSEFMKWLKKFDYDGDGRISVKELRDAIRHTGGWFGATAKARGVLVSVDMNSNGFIDDSEIDKLLVFARKQFGLKIVAI